MKFPVSRRLKTWNEDIFTEFCPFGCGKEDDEEHAFLNCKICILKDLKKYILDGLKDEKIKNKLEKFYLNKNYTNFDILMHDYRIYFGLINKKIIR